MVKLRRYLQSMGFLLLILGWISLAFRGKESINSPMEEMRTTYLNQMDMLQSEGFEFARFTNDFRIGKASLTELQKHYRDFRINYKKIEHLLEYLDYEYVKKHLNGPPLPTLDPNSTFVDKIDPKGFQVIEELLYSGEAEVDAETIHKLSQQLASDLQESARYQQQIKLTYRHLIEASRQHLVRAFSLTLTGFDSPGQFSLEDAYHSLSGLHQSLTILENISLEREPELGKKTFDLLENAISYVEKHQDFNNFNRLYFLKTFINPLYGYFYDLQLALGIETLYESTSQYVKHPVNIEARNIFDNNFLNYNFFMRASSEKMTTEVADLGKILFFDPVLSSNNKRSCASCHVPEKAFTDGLPKSLSLDFLGTVSRNAPTLINAVYADRFFHDLRSFELEDQIDHVIFSHQEFSTSYMVIFDKLSQSEEYVRLFKAAFPELTNQDPINRYSLSTAIGTYVAGLRSFNSEFDRYVRGDTETIAPEVELGFNLFMGKAVCGTCHFAPVFNGLVPPVYRESESEVLGVPADPRVDHPEMDQDLGRYRGWTKEMADFYRHSFKTTTVRNVALSAPYMHNGAFNSLEEVMDFYNQGGGTGFGYEVPHQTLPFDSLNLNEKEIGAIISFMHSLTDTTGLTGIPETLPAFPAKMALNDRKIGGEY